MHQSSEILDKVTFLTGSVEITKQLVNIPALIPFESTMLDFLNDVSKELMGNRAAKAYSDVVTFAFWIRKGSILKLKERFESTDSFFHLGKGIVFHVAPSNVPVNFAYTLVSGLLMGNANIVRVPSKDFMQISVIIDAFNKVLENYEALKNYIICIRYDRDKEINDYFSSIADERVIWGGDQTIEELRKSPLPSRSGEITFADRYSLAVIDSDYYLGIDDKTRTAEDFYNDTFFSDQNACTSPRLVAWLGNRIQEAKEIFWKEEHNIVRQKYELHPIQSVNKLTSACLAAVSEFGIRIEHYEDNTIIRVNVSEITDNLMDYKDNSGYFFEYDCNNISDLIPLCNNKKCQTIGYIGDNKLLLPLLVSGVKGIDRVVPIGKTMDFDLIWDGYNLPAHLSRTVEII